MSTFEHLFNPRAIAVIGASPEANRPGAQTIRALQANGYAGGIHPVNPKYGELAGLACYPSIAEVPKPCDLAVIALPAALVPQAVADCGRSGVRFAVVLGGGFREAGAAGQALEAQLLAAARAHGVRIVGPNCLGLVNVPAGVYAAFGSLARPPVPAPGAVSAIIQSGGFGNSLVMQCAVAGIGFRVVVASGSESDIATPELIEALVDDPGTRLILMYMEGVTDGARFVAAARRALVAGKPIVVWKAGNTSQGVRAAASHTANMTGAYDVFRAVFRQCGVVEVHDMDEAIGNVKALLAYSALPAGDAVAIMGGTGGSAVVFSDAADAFSLRLAPLQPHTREVLAASLPAAAFIDNPIDYLPGFITDANAERFRAAVKAVLADPGVSQLGVMFATTTGEQAANGGRVLAEIVAQQRKPLLVFLCVPHEHTGGGRDALDAAGIPVFASPVHVARAMRALADWYRARELARMAAVQPAALTAAVDAPLAVLPTGGSGPLSEHEGKQWLARWGIPVTVDRLFPAAPLAAGDASELRFPVALKIVSAAIAHKSEVGGVQLDIADADSLAVAVDDMLRRVRECAPDAPLDGLLVSEMIGDGVEAIVGTVSDPVFGPVVVFGVGGIFAETMRDLSYRLAPFDLETARSMVEELRASALFDGLRGRPAADREAIAEVLVRVSEVAWQLRDRLLELEINPLLVRPAGQGAVAADALIRLR